MQTNCFIVRIKFASVKSCAGKIRLHNDTKKLLQSCYGLIAQMFKRGTKPYAVLAEILFRPARANEWNPRRFRQRQALIPCILNMRKLSCTCSGNHYLRAAREVRSWITS
jgi:hypothetical protein